MKKIRTKFSFLRFSVILPAVLAAMSLVSELGTRVANTMWLRHKEVENTAGLLPYETPAFHVFDKDFLVNSAGATSPGR